MQLGDLPRHRLATLPTPVQKLDRLSQELGVDLWVKRDDLTGLAFGGNKTRKLELLLADAAAKGAKTLLTTGATQSNHCRQTAAAAAQAGFDCRLLLAGREPRLPVGNVLLDRLLGAQLEWTELGRREQDLAAAFDQAEADGQRPYLIPYGGSNPLGVAAYALAMRELLEQGTPIDRILLASSSGGTQAGLILGAGLYGFQGHITGISVDPPADELRTIIRNLLDETAAFLELEGGAPERPIEVTDRYLGAGYAVIGESERAAIHRFARTDGLLLDPVYTGRAAAGLLDMVAKGEIEQGERLLFWHTGGTPALFAEPERIL